MAKGPYVIFRRIRRAATKAKPYLIPAGPIGQKAALASFKGSIATLKTLNSHVVLRAAATASRIGAFAALQAARRHAPKGTSNPGLRSSLNARKRTDLLWTVGTNKFYARFVEEGTKAGTRSGPFIYPKKKKALAFYWRNAPSAVRARFRGRSGRRR